MFVLVASGLRLRRALWIVLPVMLAAGCAMPEQLVLPAPISATPSEGPEPLRDRPSGVPLADAPDKPAMHARLYEGTGQFVKLPADGEAGSRSQALAEGSGVTLNLAGATVAEAAKVVLGDMLQLNYAVSDKIQTTITLNTQQPVAKQDLIGLFEAVLRAEGIVIAEENGLYKIVPAEGASVQGVRWGAPRGPRPPGMATEAIPLRYVSAAEIERILKAVAPQVSILRVDPARNLLLVSGSSSELASVREAIATFDVDWMKGMSFALLPAESADVEAIAKELDTVFANDKEGPTSGMVRFIPNSRLKSVLVISSRPAYLRKAETWLRRLDMAAQASEAQVNVYHVQNRPVAELSALLRKVYKAQSGPASPQRGAAAPAGNGLPAGQAAAVLAPVAGGGPAPLAPDSQARPADADAGDDDQDAEEGNSGTAENGGNGIGIVPDEANNALVITATAREYKRIRQILTRIDVAPNQLLIEATIAEVTLNDQLKFGLKWFFRTEGSRFTLTDSEVGAVAAGFPGFSYFLNISNVKVALDALSSVTDVNIVSSPSLMVLDNKQARLEIGSEVPIATQSAQSVLTPGAPVVNSIAFRSTGVILGLTPRLSDNGRVLLDVEQEVSEVVPTTSSNLDSPTIQQRRIKTTVAVSDGHSIVLAGMMQDRNTLTRTKAPLVGDIPIVGNLFKQKDDEIKRTELLIAITPHIVRDDRQIQGITDEFRERMNLSTRPQREGPPDRRENVDRMFR